MPLPQSVKTQLQETLRDKNALSDDKIETVTTSLEQNKGINWNLILNAETEKGDGDETNA